MVSLKGGNDFNYVRTVFGYINVKSPAYNLHPVVKLSLIPFTVVYVLCTFTPEVSLISLVVMASVFKVSKVRLSIVKNYLRTLLGFLGVILIAHTFFSYRCGGTSNISLGPFNFCLVGVFWGVSIYLKVLVAVLITVYFLAITTEGDVIQALQALGFSVKTSLVVGLIFKFIYYFQLVLEDVKIGELSRGLNTSELSLFSRVKHLIYRLTPLFAIAFKKIDELSDVLEVRGFSLGVGGKRIRPKRKLKLLDFITLSILAAASLTLIYLKMFMLSDPSKSLLLKWVAGVV